MAHSSFSPGAWVHDESPVFGKAVMDNMNYWSPNTLGQGGAPSNTEYLISDGGCTDNIHIMASLRRGVRRFVLWDSPTVPLNPPEVYDPSLRPPRADDLSPDLMGYFGYFWQKAGEEARHNQIFAQSDFITVVQGLQAAQDRGTGAVATFKLTTIANEFFGISAGREVTVTFYHLGRALQWENQLPYDTRQLVIPDTGNVTDPANRQHSGELANFPFFNTYTQLALTSIQVNSLSHLTTWVVETNRDHFDLSKDPVLSGDGRIVGWRNEDGSVEPLASTTRTSSTESRTHTVATHGTSTGAASEVPEAAVFV